MTHKNSLGRSRRPWCAVLGLCLLITLCGPGDRAASIVSTCKIHCSHEASQTCPEKSSHKVSAASARKQRKEGGLQLGPTWEALRMLRQKIRTSQMCPAIVSNHFWVELSSQARLAGWYSCWRRGRRVAPERCPLFHGQHIGAMTE